MKEKKKIIYNFCYLKIKPTSSNIFVTLTDYSGKVILKSTAGIVKFSGKKKNTAYVAENVTRDLILNLKKKRIQINLLVIQLCGYLRNYSFKKSIAMLSKLEVTIIKGVYNTLHYAHNGVRLKKPKRL